MAPGCGDGVHALERGGCGRPGWLPPWAVVSEARVAHSSRVALLMQSWGEALGLHGAELASWRDAGLFHDLLRDADAATLRSLTGDHDTPAALLHGPAAANLLAADGEDRPELLAAVSFHTTGSVEWGRLGRALYMADYLDPGRPFDEAERARVAATVPEDFDSAFCQVMKMRLCWLLSEGYGVSRETIDLWNQACADRGGE